MWGLGVKTYLSAADEKELSREEVEGRTFQGQEKRLFKGLGVGESMVRRRDQKMDGMCGAERANGPTA